jgi:hypothetical protein
MKLSDYSFEDVPKMIRFVESLATKEEISKSKLDGIQDRIDVIDEKYKYDSEYEDVYYQLYELQAIVAYYGGINRKAVEFAHKAKNSMPKSKKFISALTSGIIDDLPKKVNSHSNKNDELQLDKEKGTSIVFFHQSPLTVFFLTILTTGVYSIYLFYKHWRIINQSLGVKALPVLTQFVTIIAAIFQLFSAYPLFNRIRKAANSHGEQKWARSAGFIFVVYMFCSLINNLSGRLNVTTEGTFIGSWLTSILFSFFIALILLKVQKAANFHTEKVLGKSHQFRKFYIGQIIFVVLTLGLLCFSVYSDITRLLNGTLPQGTSNQISAQRDIVNNLTKEYKDCSDSLVAKRNSVDMTNSTAVDSYNLLSSLCEGTRLKQNDAVREYDRLAGIKNQ